MKKILMLLSVMLILVTLTISSFAGSCCSDPDLRSTTYNEPQCIECDGIWGIDCDSAGHHLGATHVYRFTYCRNCDYGKTVRIR